MERQEIIIKYFKNKILERINQLRPYMSDVKYKLYKTMIDDCNTFEDIREMAELDMQFNMIKYIRDLNRRLELKNTNIEELMSATDSSNRTSKLAVISPKENSESKRRERSLSADDIDFSTLGEDLENEELLASAANMLMLRIVNEPEEQEEEDGLSIEAIDKIQFDDEDTEDAEDTDNYIFEDKIKEQELREETLNTYGFEIEDEYDYINENEASNLDVRRFSMAHEIDRLESEEDESIELDESIPDEEDIIDLSSVSLTDSNSETQSFSLDDLDNDSIDSLLFGEEEDYIEDDEETDIEIPSEDELFIDEEEEEDYETDINSEIENIEDESFIYDEDEEDLDESLDSSIDSIEDEDMFIDEEEEDLDDSSNSLDFDEDELFGEDEDDFDIEDSSDENGIDNINPDELFGEDEDDFDIDESEFEYDTDEEDDSLDDFFNSDGTSSTPNTFNQTTNRSNTQSTKKASSVFINGTDRGRQTQNMFNILVKIFSGTKKGKDKVINKTKSGASRAFESISNSDMFKL